ncbi:MAG: hypothetical protein ACRCU2_29520 [Planktothrix sp.]
MTNTESNKLIEDSSLDEVFGLNEFRQQFNYRLSEIPMITEETINFLMLNTFIMTYSALENYFKDIYNYRYETTNNLQSSSEKSLLEVAFDNLHISPQKYDAKQIDRNKNVIYDEEYQTLNYIRLRRNALVHRKNPKASSALNDFIKAKGKILNKYWSDSQIIYSPETKENKLEIKVIDFCKKENIRVFTLEEIIDVFNIVRRIVEKIDLFVLNNIGEKKLKEDIFLKFLQQFPQKKIKSQEEFGRKLKRYSRFDQPVQVDYHEEEIAYFWSRSDGGIA